MSEQENICSQCGGIRRLAYTITFEDLVPREVRVDPVQVNGSCALDIHVVLRSQESMNGNLDGLYVTYADNDLYDDDLLGTGETYKGVRIGAVPPWYGHMPLTPKQALSLLTWLRQEEETLKQMAKEQER